jgi:hypothetical protein
MRRVTRPGGVVAACVWDHGGHQGPLRLFWQTARELDPTVDDESGLAGTREGQLETLFTSAGLRQVEASALTIHVAHPTFDAWWEPFTRGVGPAGSYLAQLDDAGRAALRDACRRVIRSEPFTVDAVAWACRGLA